MSRAKLALVFTGGTISMHHDRAAGGAMPRWTGDEIVSRIPGLRDLADFEVINFGLFPGPHMTPSRMVELVRALHRLGADSTIDGIVVTHGTDTLEETAYFADLLWAFEKPVVLTGAMRNSSELSWDGPANLTAAVRVAMSPEAQGRGVMVVFSDQILTARDVTKTHTEAADPFQSRGFGSIGLVEKDRIFFLRDLPHRPAMTLDRLEERVEILKMSAGSDGRLALAALDLGIQGFVVEGLGRGNVPISAMPAMTRILASDVPVVITSRCLRGRVLDTYAYEGAGRGLKQMGAILGGWHSSAQARLKLMILLGNGATRNEIAHAFE